MPMTPHPSTEEISQWRATRLPTLGVRGGVVGEDSTNIDHDRIRDDETVTLSPLQHLRLPPRSHTRACLRQAIANPAHFAPLQQATARCTPPSPSLQHRRCYFHRQTLQAASQQYFCNCSQSMQYVLVMITPANVPTLKSRPIDKSTPLPRPPKNDKLSPSTFTSPDNTVASGEGGEADGVAGALLPRENTSPPPPSSLFKPEPIQKDYNDCYDCHSYCHY
jgi:hypothetical protein